MASGPPPPGRAGWGARGGRGLEYLPSVVKPQPRIGKKGWTRGLQTRYVRTAASHNAVPHVPLIGAVERGLYSEIWNPKYQQIPQTHTHSYQTHTHTSSSQTKWLHAAMTAATYTNTLRGTCWWKFKSIGVRTKAWQEGIHKHSMCMHYADTCTHPSANTQPIYLTRRGKSTHHFTPSLPLSSPQIRGIWPSVGQIKNVLISHANEAEFIFHNRWPHR